VRDVGARPRRTRLRDLLRDEVAAVEPGDDRLVAVGGTVRGDPGD
jgi:hypothetical protein